MPIRLVNMISLKVMAFKGFNRQSVISPLGELQCCIFFLAEFTSYFKYTKHHDVYADANPYFVVLQRQSHVDLDPAT